MRSKVSAILRCIYWEVFRRHRLVSFSQFGEDIALYKLFHPKVSSGIPVRFKEDGFYVDIGAGHPIANSQSYFFYRRGWRGIVVEPLPAMEPLFRVVRPRDKYLKMGIAERSGFLDYYIYDNPFLNSFSREESQKNAEALGAKFTGQIAIPVDTLASILSKEMSNSDSIDFMSIDTEGYDLEVLRSNDWTRYRPKFLMVEINKNNVVDLTDEPVVVYLRSKNYDINSVFVQNIMFEDKLNLDFQHK